MVGRKEEVPVKISPNDPAKMELRGVPMKNAPNEPTTAQSSSQSFSSGQMTTRKALLQYHLVIHLGIFQLVRRRNNTKAD